MTLSEIAERMMREGIDVPTVGKILDANLDDLYILRESLDINIEREDVVEAMNRLAWRSYEKGQEILETGTPAMRMAMIRMMISSMRGMMGSQSPRVMQELVNEFKATIELTDDEDEEDYDEPDEEVGEDEAPTLNPTD